MLILGGYCILVCDAPPTSWGNLWTGECWRGLWLFINTLDISSYNAPRGSEKLTGEGYVEFPIQKYRKRNVGERYSQRGGGGGGATRDSPWVWCQWMSELPPQMYPGATFQRGCRHGPPSSPLPSSSSSPSFFFFFCSLRPAPSAIAMDEHPQRFWPSIAALFHPPAIASSCLSCPRAHEPL